MYRLLISLVVFVLSACSPSKDSEGFYGISLDASPASLASSGFLCKAGADAQQVCVKFDGNPSFVGETIKEVTVSYKAAQMGSVTLLTAREGANMKDVLELSRKISAVYKPRESKMNSTGGGVHQEHWNVKGGGVLRLTILVGSAGFIRSSSSITYFPPNQVTGDL